MDFPFDKTELIDGASVNHGKGNKRAYVSSIREADPAALVSKLMALSKENGYTKVIVKAKAKYEATFVELGLQKEAVIPGLYRGEDGAAFFCTYLDEERWIERTKDILDSNLTEALRSAPSGSAAAAQTQQSKEIHQVDPNWNIRRLTEGDIPSMVAIYKEVMASYPFPIYDPAFIAATMRDNVAYYGIEATDPTTSTKTLVAVSSAEKDKETLSAEMTDFATLPLCRGKGAAGFLLREMEKDLRVEGYKTAFSIARAAISEVGKLFARHGYLYGGRLPNNTHICGSIESMNIWYKPL
jgi:putative beta-lysine N-acetyltransferase